jgi:hypothetical protein
MNRRIAALSVGIALVSFGCAEPEPTAVLPVFTDDPAMSFTANGATNAAVPLSGDEEVPARATLARGTAIFHRSDDGTALHYKLIVANIENVVQSHIHIGAFGANGPVTVFLFGPVAPAGGRVNGPIAEGTITAANLIGPLAGQTLDDLIAEMLAGNAYVNVHTDDGIAPSNTGAGDFASGEVRGQIR